MTTNTADPPHRRNRTLKVFFKLWAGLFFLALIAVSVFTVFNIYKVLHLTDRVVENSIVEMHNSMQLQMSLYKASMLPNDYLIHGQSSEREQFKTHAAEVERNFNTLENIRTLTPKQRQALDAARGDWRRARELGETMLRYEFPVGNPAASGQMEEFDLLIDEIIARLDDIHDVALAATTESHKVLHGLRTRVTTVVLALLAAGLGIAIAGFYVLNRRLFPPLKELSQGMKLFSSGQQGHRIAGNMPTELLELAEGFNVMAEKLQAQHIELVSTASHDDLTGCFNHRQFIEDYDREFSRARRYREPLSLLMVDLDHFKNVNDAYGHLAGDMVLKKVAEAMGEQLRASDILYRYGGEEFVILLPETDLKGARAVAKSICRNVADARICLDDGRAVNITVSIGLACFPRDTDSADNLLKMADHALYVAKNSGRNRVCHQQECE